jgi:uncharacterized protein DUF2784
VLSATVNMMWYRIAADLILVIHLLFIGFVVGGSFLAWRWPRIIWVQLPAMVYGALVELIGFVCPLTWLQDYLLRRGGEAGYRGGFISHYLIQVIYPPGGPVTDHYAGRAGFGNGSMPGATRRRTTRERSHEQAGG